MATKVGGFTKSGVVQCVKLVEEGGDALSGTYENGTVTFNSGLTFKFEYTSSGSSWSPLTNLVSISSISLNSSIGMSISVDANSHTAKLNGIQEPGVNSYSISNIGIVIAPATSYICRCTVSYKAMSSQYRGGGTSTSNIIFSPYQSTAFTITPEMQVINTNVKFGKDGTLRCKELIEETGTEPNLSQFDGVRSGNTILLNNGWKLEYIKSGDSAASADIFTYVERFIIQFRNASTSSLITTGDMRWEMDSSGSTTCSLSSQTGSTDDWYVENVDFLITQVGMYCTNNSFSGVGDRIRITTDPNSYFFIDFFYSTKTGTNAVNTVCQNRGIELSLAERVFPSTVRIFKDGTIKCAEVEEATREPNYNGFQGTYEETSDTAVFTLNNGMQIKFVDQTTGEDTKVIFRSVISALDIVSPDHPGQGPYLLFNDMTSQNPSCELKFYGQYTEDWLKNEVFTVTTFTLRPRFPLDSQQGPVAAGHYLMVKFPNESEWTTFTSIGWSSSGISYNTLDTPWTPSLLIRCNFSWPGSTPLQPSTTNNFLTSDSGPLITSDGQEFIVQEGGGNS